MNDLFQLLPIAVLGGLCGLDVVSFPQAMISRPIIAATAAGALLGNPTGGLLIGAVLELIALETLPFGASRYPEWGSASVVGGTLIAPYGAAVSGALAAAVLGALLAAAISGSSLIGHRRLIAARYHSQLNAIESGSGKSVVSLQLFGLTLDMVRGAAIAAGGVFILRPVVSAIVAIWGTDAANSRAVVLALAAIVAASALWKVFHQAPRAIALFLGGLAAGIGVLVIRG